MLHGIVAAGLQNVIKADDVGFHIDIRVTETKPTPQSLLNRSRV